LIDDDVNRLRIALARISRLVDRQVAGDGMTRTELSVLSTMARARSLGMSELVEIEGLNPTMLSRIVGKLDSTGLLQRTQGTDDRRSVVVQITPAGAKLHSRLRRERTRLFVDRLDRLSPAQADVLLQAIPALESLADAMRPSEVGRLSEAPSGAGR
jgi:DNA-binding MarR family transcriptional regulator